MTTAEERATRCAANGHADCAIVCSNCGEEVQREFVEPKHGTLLAYFPAEGIRGERGAIVLCDITGESVDPYVTWQMDREGNTYQGHYFEDIEDAREDFVKRCGRELRYRLGQP